MIALQILIDTKRGATAVRDAVSAIKLSGVGADTWERMGWAVMGQPAAFSFTKSTDEQSVRVSDVAYADQPGLPLSRYEVQVEVDALDRADRLALAKRVMVTLQKLAAPMILVEDLESKIDSWSPSARAAE